MSFATLLSLFLIVFLIFPSKIGGQRNESGFLIDHDGQILLTNSHQAVVNFGTFHDSQKLPGLNFRLKSEISLGAYFSVQSAGEDPSHHHSTSWHWGYENTDEWGQHFPNCLGNRQSPIDLNTDEMERLHVPTPFVWNGYSTIPRNMTVVNNGHSVELSATWNGQSAPYISGGVLESDYVFHQIHFHWGPHNNVGSEHTINNHSKPFEMHLVHYKREYGSASEAMNHEDGLAVVGMLLKTSILPNIGIAAVLTYTAEITQPGSPIEILPFPLSLFTLDFPAKYVVYLGSLTTPSCNEIVTWILPVTLRTLSQSQLNIFRTIELNGGDDHNYRPTMPLNDRSIYYVSY